MWWMQIRMLQCRFIAVHQIHPPAESTFEVRCSILHCLSSVQHIVAVQAVSHSGALVVACMSLITL